MGTHRTGKGQGRSSRGACAHTVPDDQPQQDHRRHHESIHWHDHGQLDIHESTPQFSIASSETANAATDPSSTATAAARILQSQRRQQQQHHQQ